MGMRCKDCKMIWDWTSDFEELCPYCGSEHIVPDTSGL